MPVLLRKIGLGAKYIWVRASIVGLRAIAPLSFIYLGSCIVFRPKTLPLRVLAGYAAIEVLFYLGVYLPLGHRLQKPATHPQPFTRPERRALFERCTASIRDYESYLRGWFLYGDLAEVKQDNIREFFVWSFWHAAQDESIDEEEMQEYVTKTETLLGKKFEPGRGKAKSLRVTVDHVSMLHRPLLWYVIIGFLDAVVSCRMWLHGFRHYRQALNRTFDSFPPQVFSLLARHVSPSKDLAYWYRPHKSTSKLPVVYIHGIGIGLFPYVDFLQEFAAIEPDVGIIAVEIMAISARITTPQLLSKDIRANFSQILEFHDWTSVVLASNSYGTFITTQLFHSPQIRPRIAKMLLIDPVSFLLHLPDVAYNVTARAPRKRTEWTLWYFSAKDICVSHTLHRRSFWTENIMWKEDVEGLDVTVCLAGKDIIVNSEEVGNYLFRGENDQPETWKERPWTGKGLDLIWFAEGDHADVFDYRWMRKKLVHVLINYVDEGPAGDVVLRS